MSKLSWQRDYDGRGNSFFVAEITLHEEEPPYEFCVTKELRNDNIVYKINKSDTPLLGEEDKEKVFMSRAEAKQHCRNRFDEMLRAL